MFNFKKIAVSVAVMTAVLVSGISLSAIQDDTVQGSYGSKSFNYGGHSWSLDVTTTYASSNGEFTSGTGTVYCNASTAYGSDYQIHHNASSAYISGDGVEADIQFVDDQYFSYTQTGNGANVNNNGMSTWSLAVSTTGASSSGSINNGYSGSVGCSVTGSWGTASDSAQNSCSIIRTGGAGSSASVSFVIYS